MQTTGSTTAPTDKGGLKVVVSRTMRALLLTLVAVALAGCTPAAPQAQAPAPTSPPAAAAQPTTAPAAKPTAAAAAPAATAAPAGQTAGLPADAAPADQQVFVRPYDNTADFTTLDFYESVYKRAASNSDLMTEPLVRLTKNFEIVPAAAT